MFLKETEWKGMDWIRLAQNKYTSGPSRTSSNEIIRLFRRFRVTSCLHCTHYPNLSHWRLRHHVLPKRRNKLIILHAVRTQETILWATTFVKNCNM